MKKINIFGGSRYGYQYDTYQAKRVSYNISRFFQGIQGIQTLDTKIDKYETAGDIIIRDIIPDLENHINIGMLFHNIGKVVAQLNIQFQDEQSLDDFYAQAVDTLLFRSAIIFQHSDWSAQSLANLLYGLRYYNIPKELFDKILGVIPCIDDWNSQSIGFCLYGLQNCKNVPNVLFEKFNILAQGLDTWDAQFLGMAFKGLENYRNDSECIALLNTLGGKIETLDFQTEDFTAIQALVMGLEYIDYEGPEILKEHWTRIFAEKGAGYSKSNTFELHNQDLIVNSGILDDGYELVRNGFVLGHEVDALILDNKGSVFAIIESDGSIHETINSRNKDRKRDQLFYRRGLTDLIIRKSHHGCQVIPTESDT